MESAGLAFADHHDAEVLVGAEIFPLVVALHGRRRQVDLFGDRIEGGGARAIGGLDRLQNRHLAVFIQPVDSQGAVDARDIAGRGGKALEWRFKIFSHHIDIYYYFITQVAEKACPRVPCASQTGP